MPKKILVVDDDPDIQEFCRLVLETAGYEVLLAASGAEGERMAATEHPDLVVLDIMMEAPDSGFKLAATLAGQHPPRPMIMLSSIADAADRVFDTSTLPVSALVNKPITPKELLRQIEVLLAADAKRE
jgi:two-component system alkaline phosphatase synthesis response regulator PhoP